MRKLGYVVILIVCLGAGLGVGILRRSRRNAAGGGGDGLTIGDAKPIGTGMSGSLLADAGSTPSLGDAAGTPASGAATPESTLASADATPVDDMSGGRSFGGGATADPVVADKPRKQHSSGGSDGAATTFSDNGSSGSVSSNDLPPVADHQVIDGSSRGKEVFDNPPPTEKPRKGGKKGTNVASADPVAVATPADDLGDLPVIDDPAAGATKASNLPPPDPQPTFETQVAMINNAPGDLTFPSGSGAALRKISQRQNGDKSVVKIERSGGMKYEVFRVKPNKVLIDFEETSVPGDAQQIGGSAHVKEISARYIKNSGGGIPRARVQILLTDEKLPNIDCQNVGDSVECTIGGATEKF